MSSVEPGEEFISEDELKPLLEAWIAPGPSRVLDKRIATSFSREFSGADGLSQPVLLPHRREEGISMKFCSKCEEEFADKFSFCPVDGTALSSTVAKSEEPSVTVSRDVAPPIQTGGILGLTQAPAGGAHSYPRQTSPLALSQREEYH